MQCTLAPLAIAVVMRGRTRQRVAAAAVTRRTVTTRLTSSRAVVECDVRTKRGPTREAVSKRKSGPLSPDRSCSRRWKRQSKHSASLHHPPWHFRQGVDSLGSSQKADAVLGRLCSRDFSWHAPRLCCHRRLVAVASAAILCVFVTDLINSIAFFACEHIRLRDGISRRDLSEEGRQSRGLVLLSRACLTSFTSTTSASRLRRNASLPNPFLPASRGQAFSVLQHTTSTLAARASTYIPPTPP